MHLDPPDSCSACEGEQSGMHAPVHLDLLFGHRRLAMIVGLEEAGSQLHAGRGRRD